MKRGGLDVAGGLEQAPLKRAASQQSPSEKKPNFFTLKEQNKALSIAYLQQKRKLLRSQLEEDRWRKRHDTLQAELSFLARQWVSLEKELSGLLMVLQSQLPEEDQQQVKTYLSASSSDEAVGSSTWQAFMAADLPESLLRTDATHAIPGLAEVKTDSDDEEDSEDEEASAGAQDKPPLVWPHPDAPKVSKNLQRHRQFVQSILGNLLLLLQKKQDISDDGFETLTRVRNLESRALALNDALSSAETRIRNAEELRDQCEHKLNRIYRAYFTAQQSDEIQSFGALGQVLEEGWNPSLREAVGGGAAAVKKEADKAGSAKDEKPGDSTGSSQARSDTAEDMDLKHRSALQQKITELEELLRKKEEQREDAMKQLGQMESDYFRLKTKVFTPAEIKNTAVFLDTKTALDKAEMRLTEAEEKGKAAEAEVEDLKSMLNVLERKLVSRKELEALSKQLEELQAKETMDRASFPSETTTRTLEKIESGFSELRKSFSQSIDSLHKTIERLNAAVASSSDEGTASALQEIEVISSEYERVSRECGKLKSEIAEKATQVARIESRFRDSAKSWNMVQETHVKEMKAMEEQIAALKAECSEKTTALSRALEAKMKSEELLSKLAVELQLVRKQHPVATEELARRREIASRQSTQIAELEKELKEKTQQLRVVEDKHLDYEQRISDLQTQLELKVEESRAGSAANHAKPTAGASSGLAAYERDQLTYLNRLVTCSICNERLRSVIMAKCSHTFCKECVQERLRRRSRRCPACNLSITEKEVKPLHFN